MIESRRYLLKSLSKKQRSPGKSLPHYYQIITTLGSDNVHKSIVVLERIVLAIVLGLAAKCVFSFLVVLLSYC